MCCNDTYLLVVQEGRHDDCYGQVLDVMIEGMPDLVTNINTINYLLSTKTYQEGHSDHHHQGLD